MIVELRERIDDTVERIKLLAPQVTQEIDRLNHLWECALMLILSEPKDRAAEQQYLESRAQSRQP